LAGRSTQDDEDDARVFSATVSSLKHDDRKREREGDCGGREVGCEMCVLIPENASWWEGMTCERVSVCLSVYKMIG
jgi:hypothetical protein